MYSQSILQKFRQKITQLSANDNTTPSDEGVEENKNEVCEEKSNGFNIPTSKIAQLLSKYTKAKPQQSNDNPQNEVLQQSPVIEKNGSDCHEQVENVQQDHPPILQEQSQIEQSEKFDRKDFAILIAKSKSKSKFHYAKATNSNFTNSNSEINPNVEQENENNAQSNVLPRVSTMNNLLKLSLKLNMKDFLKQINYKAHVYKIRPIKLLFYFCIEKMISNIYATNGMKKIKQNQGNHQFLMKQISKALMHLLSYLKLQEKFFINRLLEAVFIRLRISEHFNKNFLLKNIQQNLNLFNKRGIVVENIVESSQDNVFGTKIFNGIPLVQKPTRYQHLKLDLEDESLTQQLIDNPQQYQQQSKLYYFKNQTFKPVPKPLPKQPQQKVRKSTRNSKIKIEESSYRFADQGEKLQENVVPTQKMYKPSKFSIELQKVPTSQNIKKPCNSKDNVTLSNSKQLKSNSNEIKQPIQNAKRKRTTPTIKIKQQIIQKSEGPMGLDKQKIFQFIHQFIFNNVEEIAAKIAQIWQIKPQQISKILKEHPQNKSLGGANINNMLKKQQPIEHTSKERYEKSILKKIQKINEDLTAKGKSGKDVAKNVLRMLQQQNVPFESRDRVLQKWLQSKKPKPK